MTRYDFPAEIKNILKVAVDLDLIDALDIYALAIEHQENWAALVDELVTYGYATIHEGRDKHSSIVKAAEEFWKAAA